MESFRTLRKECISATESRWKLPSSVCYYCRSNQRALRISMEFHLRAGQRVKAAAVLSDQSEQQQLAANSHKIQKPEVELTRQMCIDSIFRFCCSNSKRFCFCVKRVKCHQETKNTILIHHSLPKICIQMDHQTPDGSEIPS